MNNFKEGVSIKNGELTIDLNHDWFHDIIRLHSKNVNNRFYSRNGINVFYGYELIEPQLFNKKETADARNAIRTLIKHYDKLSGDDLTKMNKLLDDSLKILNSHTPLNSFDLVVSLESSAPLNKYLISQIKPKLKQDAMIVSDLFVKDSIENLDLDWDLLDKEASDKTKDQVLTLYDRIMKTKSLFFIKDIRTGFRRYFIKFLKFKDIHQKEIFDHILAKNVLLIDDTVGEVSTFREMLRLLSMYKPKEYTCYAFLKDYSSKIVIDPGIGRVPPVKRIKNEPPNTTDPILPDKNV